mmetsp:Transcript_6232/g.19065  ORF Transcript_6232/g.19065 Transcript_6232/m.19065 type:complete len:119 (-) Transcript_6232:266-622(-)
MEDEIAAAVEAAEARAAGALQPRPPSVVDQQLAAAEEQRTRLLGEIDSLKLRIASMQREHYGQRQATVMPPPPIPRQIPLPPPSPPHSQPSQERLQLKDEMTKRLNSFATKFRNKTQK